MTAKGSLPATDAGADLRELLALMGRVIPAIKHGAGPPPRAFAEAAAHAGLGPRHVPVLLMIALEPDRSVSELAARLGLSLSAVSLMVGELSRAGLVERAEDPLDRRRTLVKLHEDHEAEVSAWMRRRMEPMRRALRRMEPAARAHFLDGWRALAEELGPL